MAETKHENGLKSLVAGDLVDVMFAARDNRSRCWRAIVIGVNRLKDQTIVKYVGSSGFFLLDFDACIVEKVA